MPYKDPAKAKAKSSELGKARYARLMASEETKDELRAKANASMKAWYRRPGNKEKVTAYRAEWREKNKEYHAFTGRLNRYKLTLDQFHARYESQDFCCAICKRYVEFEDLVVDHCHTTGSARGLLCRACNSGIGQLQESEEIMRRAVAYIHGWADRNEKISA